MASILLAGVGSVIGGNITTATIGAVTGKVVGNLVGGAIDQKIFGNSSDYSSTNHKLEGIITQNSHYGCDIKQVYGVIKLGGNIIWTSSLREHTKISSQTHGSKWRKIKYTHTDYTYTISLAIALCAGPITVVERIWADNVLLDKDSRSIRIHLGTEEQMPDPLIESIQSVGSTPAYRGLAYVVFENFNITNFNNKIPHFTFEVRKIFNTPESAENLVKAVNIIPASGEFVYDTEIQSISVGDYVKNEDQKQAYFIQRGYSKSVNCHNESNKANCLISLDQLKNTLPNVKWVAPVISWFALSLNGGDIMPGVEYDSNIDSYPDRWRVANYTRMNAHKITKINNRPIYGGTPSDQSIIRYLKELKRCNYMIMFYPILFIDRGDKPWRGRISCEIDRIDDFFHANTGYNKFVLHYAELTKGLIDAFIIGSELRGLTALHDEEFNFPVVQELIKLAKQVRAVVGKDVKISYAADWSEYHHTYGGWYHMDQLWSCEEIDFVGIDAYFPLTEWKESKYDIDEVVASWDKGEGYNFYYEDTNRITKKDLKVPYAWKNIKWWWENDHINPDGKKTAWQPKSKKIWFTEYGFPSVDLATNQPNIFYDPSSSESGLPYYSNGTIDLVAQRLGIEATEKRWQNSDMIENKFLWTWDARPYPMWPDRCDFWSDTNCWYKGHWVQGKFGIITLATLLKDLAKKSGLSDDIIDVSKIYDVVEGFIISNQTSVREIIEKLRQIYFFDVVEKDYKLFFIPRIQRRVIKVFDQDIIPSQEYDINLRKQKNHHTLVQIKNLQEAELPYKVDINFINRLDGYNMGNQSAISLYGEGKASVTLNIPMVMDNARAQRIARSALYNTLAEKRQYNLLLPAKYLQIVPSDIIEIMINDILHSIKVTNVEFGRNYILKISGVADDISIYKKFDNLDEISYLAKNSVNTVIEDKFISSNSIVEFIDIPLLPNENLYKRISLEDENNSILNNDDTRGMARILIANTARGLNKIDYGFVIKSQREGNTYSIVSFTLDSAKNAIIGYTVSTLDPSQYYFPDFKQSIIVNLVHGMLQSITYDELLSGKNMILVDNEIIQFQRAELIGEFKYRLSILLRGLFGSEKAANNQHKVGERVIIIDQNIHSLYIPSIHCNKKFQIDIMNKNDDRVIRKKYWNFIGSSLLPLSPTHLRIKKKFKNGDISITWNHRRIISDNSNLQFEINLVKEDIIISAIHTPHNEYIITAKEIAITNLITVSEYSPIISTKHVAKLVLAQN